MQVLHEWQTHCELQNELMVAVKNVYQAKINRRATKGDTPACKRKNANARKPELVKL